MSREASTAAEHFMAQSCATSNQEDRVTNPRYKGNGEGSNHIETGDGNKRTSWRGRNDGGGHQSNAERRPTGWGRGGGEKRAM
jgi:hypothetical protein